MYKSFADWLQNEMDARDWNQSKMAKMSGLTRQVISKYLRQEKIYPDPAALAAIARAFKLPAETVYQAAGYLPPTPEPRTLLEGILQYRITQLTDDQLEEASKYIHYLMQRNGNLPIQTEPIKQTPKKTNS